MAAAKRGVADIGFECVGILVDLAGFDEGSRHPVANDAVGARGGGGDDRKPARHRFECDVAECLGHRGIEEDVGTGERAGEVGADLLAEKNGLGQAIGEPGSGRAVADDEDAVRDPACGEQVAGIAENVEALFEDQPAKEADDDFVIGDAEVAAPGKVTAFGVELFAIDPASPQEDRPVHALGTKHGGGRFGGDE